jgi:hypothetical protein
MFEKHRVSATRQRFSTVPEITRTAVNGLKEGVLVRDSSVVLMKDC